MIERKTILAILILLLFTTASGQVENLSVVTNDTLGKNFIISIMHRLIILFTPATRIMSGEKIACIFMRRFGCILMII